MDEVYYIPFVYVDDAEPCCANHLVEARAECLEAFNRVHPEVFLRVGPLFNLDWMFPMSRYLY